MRVRVPFRAPFETAAGTWTARESWIVRAALADGTFAWAEALVEDARDAPVLEALLDDLVATGLPPAPPLLRRAGAAGRAMASVLDQLTLDPRDLAASLRTGVRVNATLGAGSPDEIAAAVDDALGRGFRTLKLKAGRDEPPDALVARVAAARAAAGDRVAIRLDANGAWDLEDAVLRLRPLAGSGSSTSSSPCRRWISRGWRSCGRASGCRSLPTRRSASPTTPGRSSRPAPRTCSS